MSTDIVVIGGGPAGGAMALRLARAGRQVTLIEREAGPHDKVCGEFLSGEALDDLSALGVDVLGMGAASIRSVAVARRGRRSETPLPFPALSLSRRILDEALLSAASRAGAQLCRGRRVTALERRGSGFAVTLEGGGEMQAAHAVLATGKHDLRGWKRGRGHQDDLVGFKMYWRLTNQQAAGLDGRVELFLFPGGYAGLEAIEDGRANLCLLVRKQRLARLGGEWPSLLEAIRSACPGLDARLAGAQASREKPLATAAIPYGYLARAAQGLWRLGDQAAVIPSFAGDGMAIALHSARRAAAAFLTGETAETFQAQLFRELAPQMGRALLLSRGLVHPWGQAALSAAIMLEPRLMRAAAARTRIQRAPLDERATVGSHYPAA